MLQPDYAEGAGGTELLRSSSWEPTSSYWGGCGQRPGSVDGEDKAQGGEVTFPGLHKETHLAVHSLNLDWTGKGQYTCSKSSLTRGEAAGGWQCGQ